MIDFSKYTLTELQAMSAVLDDLTYRMSISETMKAHMLPYHYYKEVTGAVAVAIDQQARDHEAAEAEKVDRIKEACIAGAPPAIQCSNIEKCGVCLTECPFIDEDPDPAPDMFGWVGDALDGLHV